MPPKADVATDGPVTVGLRDGVSIGCWGNLAHGLGIGKSLGAGELRVSEVAVSKTDRATTLSGKGEAPSRLRLRELTLEGTDSGTANSCLEDGFEPGVLLTRLLPSRLDLLRPENLIDDTRPAVGWADMTGTVTVVPAVSMQSLRESQSC